MTNQKERETFLYAMAKERVSLPVARQVLRYAAVLQRHANRERSSEPCNKQCPKSPCLCDYDELTDTHQTVTRRTIQVARLQTRLKIILRPFAVTVTFPISRSCGIVKLQVPSGKTDDWGQTGLSVPTDEE